jgi:hypothetical protein
MQGALGLQLGQLANINIMTSIVYKLPHNSNSRVLISLILYVLHTRLILGIITREVK